MEEINAGLQHSVEESAHNLSNEKLHVKRKSILKKIDSPSKSPSPKKVMFDNQLHVSPPKRLDDLLNIKKNPIYKQNQERWNLLPKS